MRNDGNQAKFRSNFNEQFGGALYIAWIEHALVDGSAVKYGRLYAAKVICTPSLDEG